MDNPLAGASHKYAGIGERVIHGMAVTAGLEEVCCVTEDF